jgi:hypothetical protein
MSKTKSTSLILLSLLAVLAVNAVASSSALAAEKCATVKTEWEFCSGGNELETATPVEGTSGTSTLSAGGITIECAKDTLKGVFEDAGKSQGEVNFTSCKVAEAPNCNVAEPIEFPFKSQLVGKLETGKEETEFKPAEGTTFVEITISGSACVLKGKYTVTGTQTCKMPKPEEVLAEHTIECTPAGSSLKLGGATAEFTSTVKVKLASGKTWTAKLS